MVRKIPNQALIGSYYNGLLHQNTKNRLLMRSLSIFSFFQFTQKKDCTQAMTSATSFRKKPGFHMIVTVGDASPRQARGHIGDGCVKLKHFLNDVANVADQTGTVWGRIERVEMSLKRGFHMIITVIVSICPRLIGDTSPKLRRLLRSYGNQALLFPLHCQIITPLCHINCSHGQFRHHCCAV